MSKTKSSLGRFGAPTTTQPPAPAIAAPVAPPAPSLGRKKSKPAAAAADDEFSSLLVRLPATDHKQLKRRAVDEDISVQELMLRGADAYLRSKGLPGLHSRR